VDGGVLLAHCAHWRGTWGVVEFRKEEEEEEEPAEIGR